MNIHLIYDASVGQAPAGFTAALTAVAQFLNTQFTNPITINIQVGYGEINGQAMSSGALGQSLTYFANYSYSQVRNALLANAHSADQVSAASTLPAGDPTNGGNYWVSTANAKALGLPPANAPVDGYVGFASSYPFDYDDSNGVSAGTYDFYGVAMHEFTEVLGRVLFVGVDGIGANAYTPLDLFHYSANGVHDFAGTTPGYFSLNSGQTNLDNFNTNPGGDFGDWAASAGHDSFLAFSSSGVINAVSQADLRVMNVIGYNVVTADVTPPTLVLNKPLTVGVGQTVTITSSFLAFSDTGNPNTQLTYSVVTGPADGTLLKSGIAVSSFTQADVDNGLISYHETATNASADAFTFYVADPAGNHTATQTFQLQISFAIEQVGSTWLTQVGNQYYLYNTGGTGPTLKYGGAAITSAQMAGWTPIGAEQTAGGYEVAWKTTAGSPTQYAVWNTDGTGNFTSSPGVVSGANAGLESVELSFQQDLNGDGVIGVPGTAALEASGSSWLTQVGNQYFLYDTSGVGPTLKYGGTPVTAGEFVGWTPIGAEPTASGYEVAWKTTIGTTQYAVWNTDGSGNFTSSQIGTVSGTSPALEWLEPSFQQDLNGDGVIGRPGTIVIESNGSTWLSQVGNQYSLYDTTGSGPSLMYGGLPVTVGEFLGWVPIAAQMTAGGYEVAWKTTTGATQYAIWNTDGSGNFTTSAIGVVSGTSTALQALEPGFQQDLNGDGVIGVPGSSAPSLNLVLSDEDLATPNIFSFASEAGGSLPSLSQIVASADFYGDGSSEILWLGPNNTPGLSEVSGGSVLGTAALPAPSSAWHLVGAGDLDGNGKSDILWQNTDGAVSIWDVDRNGTVATSVPGNPGPAWQLTGAADVNGDGKADLLFLNSAESKEQVWLMDGPQVQAVHTFAAGSASNAPSAPLSAEAVLGEMDHYLPDPGSGGGMDRGSDGGAIALLTPDEPGRSDRLFAGS